MVASGYKELDALLSWSRVSLRTVLAASDGVSAFLTSSTSYRPGGLTLLTGFYNSSFGYIPKVDSSGDSARQAVQGGCHGRGLNHTSKMMGDQHFSKNVGVTG